MLLKELLNPETTKISVDVASKKRCLEVASEMLATSVSGTDEDSVFSGLLNRERLGSTGIGSGVGIPHCRISGADKAAAVLIRLEKPIDFDAIDKERVDIICALIVPDDGNDEHLKTLAGLAELFANTQAMTALRESDSDQSFFETAIKFSNE